MVCKHEESEGLGKNKHSGPIASTQNNLSPTQTSSPIINNLCPIPVESLKPTEKVAPQTGGRQELNEMSIAGSSFGRWPGRGEWPDINMI